MKILLTGATGYLGSRLLPGLLSRGHQVDLLIRSTSNLERLGALRDKVRCYEVDRMLPEAVFGATVPVDLVVHAAASYGRQGESEQAVVEANLTFPRRLLEAAVDQRVPAFINVGTSLGAEVSLYARTKQAFRQSGLQQADSGQIRFIQLALEHFYGPGDDPSKFITWLVRSCLQQVPILELTAGEQLRDFIHIDDVVAAILLLLERQTDWPIGYHELSVGSGTTVSIRELVETIRELTCSHSRLLFGARPYRPHEEMHAVADIGRLRELGWQPQVALEEGLKQLIAFEAEVTK